MPDEVKKSKLSAVTYPHRVVVYVDDEGKEQAQAIAAKRRRKVADALREVIREEYERMQSE
jgi:hypothetical protein